MAEKQIQHRAPKGKPEHTTRIGLRVPKPLLRKFQQRGGSRWLRELMQAAP